MKAEAVRPRRRTSRRRTRSRMPASRARLERRGLARDRRDSRWDEHRRARRDQLVEATLAAVGKHGAGVGMDEIAAEAGTSKTVVYRHFADRAELYVAVCNRVASQLLPKLRARDREQRRTRGRWSPRRSTPTWRSSRPTRELYRFVVHQQALDRPAGRPDRQPVRPRRRAGRGRRLRRPAAGRARPGGRRAVGPRRRRPGPLGRRLVAVAPSAPCSAPNSPLT